MSLTSDELEKTVIVSTTKYCPYSCEYCIAMYSKKHNPLDFELAMPLLRKLSGNGWTMEFTGGEPFRCIGIINYVNELSNLSPRVEVLTNGFYLKEIEKQIDPKVELFITWHPDMISLEKFYVSDREKNDYHYIVHPKRGFYGNMDDIFMFEQRFGREPKISFFEGIWKGEFYNCDHKFYDNFDRTFSDHLRIPRKNLNIECDGYIYYDYNFDYTERIGHISDFPAEQAEMIDYLSYVQCNKSDNCYKEIMKQD